MLNEQAAERIHEASLELLASPGVRFEHDHLVALLLKAGAQPGTDAQDVRFPKELVMECLAQAPSEILLDDRQGTGQVLTPNGEAHIWTAPGLNIDRRGTRRRFTQSDMADVARLVQQLDSINGVVGMSMEDAPPAAGDVIGLRLMTENTKKHVRMLSASPEGAEAAAEMRAVLGDTPWFSMGFTAHGPLRWTHLALEIFARSAGKGIPVTINGEPMAGTSGPVTLAGSAAVGNAEILAGIVLNQLLEPGRPCIYNLGLAHIFDMRTAIAVTGAPENHLLADISAAMGRYYNIPSSSWVSTESMGADSQSALEKSIGFLTHLQSRSSLIWGAGQLESELTLSPAQAVIDDEIVRYARRYLQGVDVTDETLALDVIKDVGIGGEFLSHDHTFTHFRSAFFEPSLLFRKKREAWVEEGSPSLTEAAEARADELIAMPTEPVITDAQREALLAIEKSLIESKA